MVILNRNLLRQGADFDEVCVTIIHELLHLVLGVGVDVAADSREEAFHDIVSYTMLGLGIPSNHWMFQKYPDLPVEN